MTEKRIESIKFLAATAVYAILEKQHNGMMREKQRKRFIQNHDENTALFRQLDMKLHGIK